MALIRDEISRTHLMDYPAERPTVQAVAKGFHVNWARARTAYNTKMSVYIVGPDELMKDTFGFSSEIALFITHFEDMQNRTMQAIQHFLSEEPLRGRCDRSLFLVVVPSESGRKKVIEYATEFDLGWIPVVLVQNDLRDLEKRKWGLRSLIADQLFTRDLFDTQLPVRSDIEFFGRDATIFDLVDAAKRGQNRGVFGLRKTGKTSLLFKVSRILDGGGEVDVIYLDCKQPSIRKLSSEELINAICDRLLEKRRQKTSAFRDVKAYDRLPRVLQSGARSRRLCLIFDEIEYITPLSLTDKHWKTDFIDFWQALWATQSIGGQLSFVICGVNPGIVEIDTIDGIQNPLFGIVPATYLRGLEFPELGRMANFFGNRMGLRFAEEALKRLHLEYGGHPLLTRKACSFIHSMIGMQQIERPHSIDRGFIDANIGSINSEIEFYFKHVLSELERFYPEEYDMLNFAVSGQNVDFSEFARDPQLTRHLTQYGLLRLGSVNQPIFLIESIKGYLARDAARRDGRRYAYKVLDGVARDNWLRGRLISLTKDFRHLNAVSIEVLGFSLFTGDTVARPEDFVLAPSADTAEKFKAFLSTTNMLVNENIEAAAKKDKRKGFYFDHFRSAMPALFDALHRLRVYRNTFQHDKLDDVVDRARSEYLRRDLGHVPESFSLEEMRILQQIILDEIFLALQEEMSRLSS